jgi:carbamoyl-phosphate synthase large subunit
VPSTVVLKWAQREGGERTTIVDRIHAGEIDLIVNTPWGTGNGGQVRVDGYEIRTAAVTRGIPCMTTIQGLAACVQGIEALVRGDIGVTPLQEYHAILHRARSQDEHAHGHPDDPDEHAEENG